MKILLLRQYNPFIETGASANRFRDLIEGLRSLGHTVDIAIVGGVIQQNEEKFCDVDVVYLSKANRFSFWWSRANKYLFERINNSIANWRFKKLNILGYDIIWITKDSQVLSLYRKNRESISCKSFIELNEFNDIYKGNGATGNFMQRLYGNKEDGLLRETIKDVDLFGVMTITLLEYYRKMAKPTARFMHLPMTVDMSRFAHTANTKSYNEPYVAFTGTMSNAKDGVDILIKAFAKIVKKYPGLNLYLAGFWHYDVPGQEALIKQSGLTDTIHYIEVLNREQIPPFIGNASVLVLSRPDSHQAQGGFPTKLGEYLATGNPVCVTRVGEIPDYLEDNVSAFMASPGDVDSFVDALDRALSDPEKAKRVGLNGRQVAEKNFDAKIQTKRLADFLEHNLQNEYKTTNNS